MHDPWRVEGLDLQGPNYAIVRRTRVCPIQRAGIPAGAAEREASPNEPVVVGKRRRRRGKGKRATSEERAIGREREGREGGREQERRWAGGSKGREEMPGAGAVWSSRGGGLARADAGDAGNAGGSAAGIIRAAASASAAVDASESVGCAATGIAAGIASGNGFAGRANRRALGGGVAESGGGRDGPEREAEGGGRGGEEESSAERLLSEAVETKATDLNKGRKDTLVILQEVSQRGAQNDGHGGFQGVQQQQDEVGEGEKGEEEREETVGGSSRERGAGVWQASAQPTAGGTAGEAGGSSLAASARGGTAGGGMAEDGISGGAAGVGSVCAGRVVKGKGPGQYLFRAEDGEGFTSVDVGANGMSVVCNARGCRPVRVDESFVDRHGLPQSLSQLPNGAGRIAEGGGVGEMEGGDGGLDMGGVGEILGGDVGESVWGEGGVVGGEAEDGGGVGRGGEGERERRPVGKGENGLAVVERGKEAIMEVERREDERAARSGWEYSGVKDGGKMAEGRDGGEATEGSSTREESEVRNESDEREEKEEREEREERERKHSGESGSRVPRAGVRLNNVSKDDPTNALLLCDYARFLCEIKDYHRADEMFRRAVAASQAEGRARVKGRAAGMDQSPSSPTNNGGLKGLKGAKGVAGVKGVTGVEEGEVLVLWAKAVWEGWRDGERALALFDHAVEVAPHDWYVQGRAGDETQFNQTFVCF
ncbi:unnamed protein product [Closterium sp. NIES-64]|nr:unnamed protein product [Closterium sp. NIES-64]